MRLPLRAGPATVSPWQTGMLLIDKGSLPAPVLDSSPHPCEVGTIVPMLEVRKQRLVRIQSLAHRYTVRKRLFRPTHQHGCVFQGMFGWGLRHDSNSQILGTGKYLEGISSAFFVVPV